MPHLDHTGPESKGPKTGRKLGHCRITEEEKKDKGIMGKGMGKKLHSGGGKGKGKRKKYNQIS